MISLTVVMPALNEEANIKDAVHNVLEAFGHFNIDGELIVVNDGSSDGTASLVQGYITSGDSRVRILHHGTPQGIGASFWDGVAAAGKEAVVMLPGDAENDAHEIVRYLRLIEYVDMVIPFVTNKQVRSRTRNLLSWLFLCIINMTFGLRLNYTNGTVIYKRQILLSIRHRERGFFYQVEALIKAIKKGYTFAEVPYLLSTRRSGVSTAVSRRTLKNVVRGYFALVRDIYLPFLVKR